MAGGPDRSLAVEDLTSAAAANDANMIILDAPAGRQPGARNWLWLKAEVQGVDALHPDAGLDVLDLEHALQRLEAIAPDKAKVVELRFYGGLSIEDTAEAMALSPATVKRHWQTARIWLFDALNQRDGAPP